MLAEGFQRATYHGLTILQAKTSSATNEMRKWKYGLKFNNLKSRKISLIPMMRQEKLTDLLLCFLFNLKRDQMGFMRIPSLHFPEMRPLGPLYSILLNGCQKISTSISVYVCKFYNCVKFHHQGAGQKVFFCF